MKISAEQAGNWVRISYDYDGGIHVQIDCMMVNDALDLYHALHALFQIRPPLEPSESNSDA